MFQRQVQEIESAQSVGSKVDERVGDARPDTCAGGEVYDGIKNVVFKTEVESLSVLDIKRVEFKAFFVLQLVQTVFLHGNVVVVVHVIEPDDLVAIFE
jgi:hypothetical protein